MTFHSVCPRCSLLRWRRAVRQQYNNATYNLIIAICKSQRRRLLISSRICATVIHSSLSDQAGVLVERILEVGRGVRANEPRTDRYLSSYFRKREARLTMAHVGGAKSKGLPQTLTLDHVSPATRLLEKRRQMFEVQEALNAQKEDFQRREEAFRRREEGLRQKDLELQESLIKFNKFLQENESKRNRAEKRARDEGRQTVEKGKEIYKKSAECEQMQLECAKVKEKLRKMSRYRDFLERAQRENAEDYPEISDLESRYKTLVSSNRELIEGQRENERKNEDQRAEFSDYTKTETNKMLNSNNLIANLQQRLESEEAAAAAAQDDFDESIRKTGDETLEVGQVVMAVQNLLLRCTKNHGAIKHYDDSKNSGGGIHTQDAHTTEDEMLMKGEQTAAELDVIAAYITDFSAIVDQFNTMHKKVEQKTKKDDEPAEDS